MFALTTVDQLILRINGVDHADLRPTLYANLVSATTQIKSIFRLGNLDPTVGVVDDFYITRDIAKRGDRYLHFKLTNGFVDQTTNALTAIYGGTEDDLSSAPIILDEFLKINEERGTVRFDSFGFNSDLSMPAISRRIAVNFIDFTFRITYDHGLAVGNTPDGKRYTGVPDWLEESALIKGREIYQITNPSKDNPADANAGNLEYLIADHIRIEPGHIDVVR